MIYQKNFLILIELNNTIMKSTKYLLGILLTILLGSWLHKKHCCDCDTDKNVEKTTIETVENSDVINKFQLSTEGLDYTTSQNFKFLRNSFNTIEPISDSINIGIDELKSFLGKNQKRINITGYALSSEKNTTIYENLGIARATEIKNYLISKGIDGKKIDVFGVIEENLTLKSDTIIGPQKFEFLDITTETSPKVDYTKLKEEINANPLVMYFKTGEASINLSDEDRKKVSKMLEYLENVEGAKLDVVGHTDNVGKRDVNVKLGLDRANFATSYLIENGIAKEKIASSSKGPDEPIAENKTVEGREKNRRTVVSLK